MKFLLKIFLYLVIFATFSFSAFVLWAGPCYMPITYSLGSFDTKFGISKETFLGAVKDAENIWEKAAGKDLFQYKEKGRLSMNLIYDDRQETAVRNKNLESKIDQTEMSAKSVRALFESLKSRHETDKTEYASMVESYKTLQSSYNEKVSYWNSRGGAPKDEFNTLENQKRELQKMQGLLEVKRTEINSLVEEINDLVSKYNYLVNEANSNIDVINQSADKEFEQGEYVAKGGTKQINIYEFTDINELKRILAHELGHALGIDHNDDPKSIMYYLNKGVGLVLSTKDILGLKSVCRIK